jgi:hypothetical protein
MFFPLEMPPSPTPLIRFRVSMFALMTILHMETNINEMTDLRIKVNVRTTQFR